MLTVLHLAIAVAHGQRKHKVQKLKVHFLAEGTFLRRTWGYNQDTYLAKFSTAWDKAPSLICVVDEYSPLAPALAQIVLNSDKGAMLRVRRDEGCDAAYGDMLLRAATEIP